MVIYPSCEEEQQIIRSGYRRIAGLDEVGRGAWAGPVAAAAVVLPPELLLSSSGESSMLSGVRDSKQLTFHQREELWPIIKQAALSFGVGFVPVPVIDSIGIAAAGRLAMRRAIRSLSLQPDFLLIDAFQLPTIDVPQKGIIDGDCLCLSIAAASVVAKVARDHLMAGLHGDYPYYGFAHNKGYGTSEHYRSIVEYGACCHHRRSFSPVKDMLSGALTRPVEEE
ncbi:MAG: ribonuclease HII [Candidatus Marsarchaeota archaeon]|nr:ribonuclease HII [Candidatus Marsarchaeota archaeon]